MIYIKAILFWLCMSAIAAVTLVMALKGVPLYLYLDTAIDRVAISPWWLFFLFEVPIAAGFLVRGQWGSVSNFLLGGMAFCLSLDFYVHICTLTRWDGTAVFELALIIFFVVAAALGAVYRKSFR